MHRARRWATLPPVRAVLLDLDDTLFDRERALTAWAATRGLDPARVIALDGEGHRPRAELLAELCITTTAEQFPLELAGHVEPEPGDDDAVATLAARGRVAIITNGGPAQRIKLARLGLNRLVHAVFVSSELGIAKPARAFFEHALRWTGCPAADVLVVGDQPAIDLEPAAALGMQTAWLRRRGAARADHRTIAHVAELAA